MCFDSQDVSPSPEPKESYIKFPGEDYQRKFKRHYRTIPTPDPDDCILEMVNTQLVVSECRNWIFDYLVCTGCLKNDKLLKILDLHFTSIVNFTPISFVDLHPEIQRGENQPGPLFSLSKLFGYMDECSRPLLECCMDAANWTSNRIRFPQYFCQNSPKCLHVSILVLNSELDDTRK